MVRQNLIRYYKSITEELEVSRNRVRDLIGTDNWKEDGAHKEELVRAALRRHVPETVRVGHGFVCRRLTSDTPETAKPSSGQIDVLLSKKSKPTLYKQHDLAFVTADAVHGAIEVKTEVYGLPREQRVADVDGKGPPRRLDTVLQKLADRAQFIRTEAPTSRVMVGLFVFEPAENSDQIDEPEWAWDPRWLVLQALRDAAQNDRRRVIDLVVLGSGTFVKFWENGGDVKSRVDGPVWHQYWLPHLAPAYFLNNFVHHATGHMTGAQQAAIYPLRTKEDQRRAFCDFQHGPPTAFPAEDRWGSP